MKDREEGGIEDDKCRKQAKEPRKEAKMEGGR